MSKENCLFLNLHLLQKHKLCCKWLWLPCLIFPHSEGCLSLWYSSHILPVSKLLDFEWHIIASGAWVLFSMSYVVLSSSEIAWENEFTLKSAFFSPLKKVIVDSLWPSLPFLQTRPLSLCSYPVSSWYLWVLRIAHSKGSFSPISGHFIIFLPSLFKFFYISYLLLHNSSKT